MAGTGGFFFFFLVRAGEMFASKGGRWDDGLILPRGDVVYFGAVLNSIGQCGVRLIMLRYGFGAQKGIDCGTER